MMMVLQALYSINKYIHRRGGLTQHLNAHIHGIWKIVSLIEFISTSIWIALNIYCVCVWEQSTESIGALHLKWFDFPCFAPFFGMRRVIYDIGISVCVAIRCNKKMKTIYNKTHSSQLIVLCINTWVHTQNICNSQNGNQTICIFKFAISDGIVPSFFDSCYIFLMCIM